MTKRNPDKVMAFRVPRDLVNAIIKQARLEQRTRSNMLTVLVRRGLSCAPVKGEPVNG